MQATARAQDAATRAILPPQRLPRLLPAGFTAGPVSMTEHLARYGSVPAGDRGRAGRAAALPP